MSVEWKILRYLKENPGATPRLIADALGLPLSQVRIALNRLRDSGQVVRVPGEGYYARAAADPTVLDAQEAGAEVELRGQRGGGLASALEKLSEEIALLTSRVDRLEKEVREIKVTLEALSKAGQEQKPRAVPGQEFREDKVIRELKTRKVMRVGDALTLAAKPLDEYVRDGVIVVVSDLAVDPEFYERFLSKFPIRKLDVPRLSDEERELMNAMIREGAVYLHGGREYRLASPRS